MEDCGKGDTKVCLRGRSLDEAPPLQALHSNIQEHPLTRTSPAPRFLTVGDEGPAGQDLAQHELDHGQDHAHDAAHDGDAEEEVILREKEREEGREG
ncbi:hypothetical protein JZ751_029435 [Albula glossodonta]|uniref:Uncharacterized protein n=1 Tax=Albula glossodonta TaxID=121402 RepID=A0A8T2P9B0_9TELE|nr:hypothetical protein JZ751_029435 [Albula glossodonta]